MTCVDGRLSDVEAAAIVRRAVELDAGSPGADLDVAAVRDVVRDLGVSDSAFTRALAEWRAGALTPAGSPPGPAGTEAVCERVVPLAAERAAARLDTALRRQCFDRVRRAGADADYVRRRGVIAGVQRTVNLRGRHRLKDVPRIRIHVQPCGAESTLLRLAVDLTGHRRELRAGLVAAPAALGALTAAAAVVGPDVLLLGAPAGAAVAAGGWAGAQGALARRRAAVTEALAAVLDSLC